MPARVLVVDDSAERGPGVVAALSFRFECRRASGFDEAVRALSESPEPWDVVVTDFDLGGPGTGMQVLELARTLAERTIRVFYTSYFVDAVAQEALRRTHAHAVLDARAVDFLSRLREYVERLVDAGDPGGGEADGAVGLTALRDAANPMVADWCAHAGSTRTFLARLQEAAAHRGPVYAVGEEGTGKHLARRTLRAWCGSSVPGVDPQAMVRFVHVPPLRERRADVVPLARRLLERLAETRPPARRLGVDVEAMLAANEWPGNVRALHSAVLSAWQKVGGRREIQPRDFAEPEAPPLNPLRAGRVEGELERMLLLLQAERTVNAAARRADQTPQNFRRSMDRLGVLRVDPGAAVDDPGAMGP